jgi:hypothetical protein
MWTPCTNTENYLTEKKLSKQFSMPKSLKRHIDTVHMWEKKYECDSCKKKYLLSFWCTCFVGFLEDYFSIQ